jgi:hypothetical protein
VRPDCARGRPGWEGPGRGPRAGEEGFGVARGETGAELGADRGEEGRGAEGRGAFDDGLRDTEGPPGLEGLGRLGLTGRGRAGVPILPTPWLSFLVTLCTLGRRRRLNPVGPCSSPFAVRPWRRATMGTPRVGGADVFAGLLRRIAAERAAIAGSTGPLAATGS